MEKTTWDDKMPAGRLHPHPTSAAQSGDYHIGRGDRGWSSVPQLLWQRSFDSSRAIAVDDGKIRCTYEELRNQSDAISEALHHTGVKAGDAVGVVARRDAATVAAIVGTAWSGAAYVPLDASYPSDRLERMVVAAAIRTIVVPSGGSAVTFAGLPLVSCDRLGDSRRAPGSQVPTHVEPGAPAYILFTSGSSGRPKGVVVPHEAMANFVGWGLQAFTPGELAVVAGTTSFCFDPSVFEIFVTLASGGLLRVLASALSLAELAEGPMPTMALAAPSAIGELIRSRRFPKSLRTLMTGGEPLPARLANQVFERTSAHRLVFAYGPTEATVTATAFEVEYPAVDPVPIGGPLPGVEVQLVDGAGSLVTEGAVGEIQLGGVQVATGYCGDDLLTSDRFRTGGDGRRVYRTGDFARLRPDGALEFKGRLDRQVKIRGFRVEPSEIEAGLAAHPGVDQAFVAAIGSDEHLSLVAWVIPVAEEVSAPDLRSHLRSILPSYMVPSAFVTVRSFSVNGSGKVDASCLPSPYGDRRADETEAVGDLDPDEAVVARLVRDILHFEGPIHPEDDFLDDLGGTSLSATRLLFELEERFGLPVPMTVILADTTVAGLARAVRSYEPGGCLTANLDGTRAPLVLVHAWLGPVVRYRRLQPHIAADRPLIGIHVHDEHPGEPRLSSIGAMAARAIEQLQAVRPHGPYVVGGHSTGGFIAYEMAVQLRSQGESVPRVVLFDAPVPEGRLHFVIGQLAWNLPDMRDRPVRALVQHTRRFIVNRTRNRRVVFRRRGQTPTSQRRAEDTIVSFNRANYGAVKKYRPQPSAADLIVLSTDQGRRRSGGHAHLGWNAVTSGRIASHPVEGTHDGMFEPERVAGLGRLLEGQLLSTESDVSDTAAVGR
jgi:amino acid adenylation domain-containing protein